MSIKLTRPILALLLLICAALLVAPPLAGASDASIRRVMKPYEQKLTVDIGYLSTFSAPSRSVAPRTLRKLSGIRTELTDASHALEHQKASSRNGRRGRTDVLEALRNALTATADARNSARAARAGHGVTARNDVKAEQREIGKAITQFETGGQLLHLS